jgi:hypothetical protein
VPVEELEGAYGTGEWAEPDLGAASSAMRRLYDNPTLRAQLVMSAQQHLDEMPSMFDTGVQMRSFLDQLPALSSEEQRDS